MLTQLSRYWWVIALRGVVAILFGIIAFSQPTTTLVALVWLWGAYAIADGVCALFASVRAAEQGRNWGMLLLSGLCGIVAGIIAFAWTGITALVLLYLVAAWAIVTGILEIAAAIGLRQIIEGEWLLGLSGVLSVLLGVALIANPRAGLVATVWMIGVYALLFGVTMLALAFRLRTLGHPSVPHSTTA
ncbi:MAG TPA: HdeD family acid-resistance protein [Chthonomonadaceae bacterium]|nr:HdeD family acid-resistance protein [Chthonomonadaceae bacterium]